MEDIGNIFYVMFTLESFTEYWGSYILLHAFLSKKILVRWHHVLLILFFFLINFFGIFFNEGSGRDSLLPPTFVSLIMVIFFAIMTRLLFKKQWGESFLLGIYTNMLQTLLFLVCSIPFLLLITFWDVNIYFLAILLYLATLSASFFLYRKAFLNKLYQMTTQKTIFSVLVSRLLVLLYLVVLFFLNHNNRTISILNQLTHLSIVLLIVVFLVIPAIKNFQKQAKEEVSKHDLYNDILSTSIALENTESIDEVKAKFKAHAERLGIDLTGVSQNANRSNPVSQQIERFIKLKQGQHRSKVEVITDIGYYNDHETVDLQPLLQWLGTLLDNAIEASVTHPIYVRLMVTLSRLSLQVSNEYLGTDRDNFEQMFEKGHSTKGEGRGLGLYHLNETVINLGGTVACFEEYNEVHRTSYLNLLIKFR